MTKKPLSLFEGTLDFLVLKILSRNENMYGLSIIRSIRDATEGDLLVKPGALYPALHRMEKRGWLDSARGTSKTERQVKFYRLTHAGREELEIRESAWTRYVEAVSRLVRAAEA